MLPRSLAQVRSRTQIVDVRVDGNHVGYGFVLDGKTYVPLRDVASGFACTVNYDADRQQVLITRPAPVTEPPPLSEKTIRFSGSESRKTEPFRITAPRWKITWKHSPDRDTSFFNFTLRSVSDGSLVDMVANTTKAGGETSYQYKPGEFYLDITASADYEIIIEQ